MVLSYSPHHELCVEFLVFVHGITLTVRMAKGHTGVRFELVMADIGCGDSSGTLGLGAFREQRGFFDLECVSTLVLLIYRNSAPTWIYSVLNCRTWLLNKWWLGR